MRRAALLLELVLELALVALLVVAAYKLSRVLARMDAGVGTELAFGLVFLAAAVVAGRKAISVARTLLRNEDDGISRRR